MKKLVFLFILLFSISPAFSENIDLSGLSYEELVILRDRIDIAMWQSKEWKEVTVPAGVWVVGEDIPAGHWTVYCHRDAFSAIVSWGESLDAGRKAINAKGRNSTRNTIYNRSEEGSSILATQYSFEVIDGDYIVIQKGPVIFVPYAGKPDLGFDWGD